MARPFESTTDKIMREAIEAQRGLVPFGSVSALDRAAQDSIKIHKAMEDALGGSTPVAKAAQDALRSQKLMEETLGGSTALGKTIQDAFRSQKLMEETLGASAIVKEIMEDRRRFDEATGNIALARTASYFDATSQVGLPPAGSPFHQAAGVARLPARPKIERANQSIGSAADLAPLIRKARKRMGMNQEAFAFAAGVGRRFLSELENGKSSLEFDKVLACAQAAGIDIIAKPRLPL
jgi:y4mF family transcriptional regulator